ncbi:hypothetical protein [Luteolibacter soli]|uniref:DUF1795 domain-containing protein n=1 Tax=Luteolibacter soli TaxID=3135280 RepID=A0ABU9ASH2_9BACT
MKRSVFLPLVLAAIVLWLPAPATAEGVVALKSVTGALVVWDVPDCRFTVEIPGDSVKAMDNPDNFFLNVGGIVFQIQTTTAAEVLGKKAANVAPKELLQAHRDWEEKYIEKLTKSDLTIESEFVSLRDGTNALSWSYAMPKGVDTQISRQIYLTRVASGHVIVLNAAVPKKMKPETVSKSLVAAANSFVAYKKPIDLKKIQESLREAGGSGKKNGVRSQ